MIPSEPVSEATHLLSENGLATMYTDIIVEEDVDVMNDTHETGNEEAMVLNTDESEKWQKGEDTLEKRGAAKRRETASKKRLQSLDCLRGLDMFFMILVDNQAGTRLLWPLAESSWNGLHVPADCVFPAFVFIMGTSIALALRYARLSSPRVWFKILKRTFLLFVIGLFLNWWASNFSTSHFVIMGVLQRIALCYFAVALMHMLLPLPFQFGFLASLLTFFLIIFYRLNTFEGCGHGKVTPECNAGAFVDEKVFGSYRMYPTEPEGLLTTIPAIISTFTGYLMGRMLNRAKDLGKREVSKHNRSVKGAPIIGSFIYALLIYALSLLSIGLLLLIWIPCTKKVWSLSFTFITSALPVFVFLVMFLVIDVVALGSVTLIFPPFVSSKEDAEEDKDVELAEVKRKPCCSRFLNPITRFLSQMVIKMCHPLLVLGMNPLLVFIGMVGLEIIMMDNIKFYRYGKKTSLWMWVFDVMLVSWFRWHAGASFIISMCHVFIWVFVAGFCHWRGWFLKL